MSTTVGIKDGTLFVLPNGQLLEIGNSDKGEQDLVEIFLTVYTAAEDYGNELFSLVGEVNLIPELAVSQAGMIVEQTFERFKALQQEDAYLSTYEEMVSLENVQVEQANDSTGNLVFSFDAYTTSGTKVGDRRFDVSIAQANPPGIVAGQGIPGQLWPLLWTAE